MNEMERLEKKLEDLQQKINEKEKEISSKARYLNAKAEELRIREMGIVEEEIESKEDKNNMFECPYIIGVHCNQKEKVCDKGQFEAQCVMLALRQIDHAIESSHEVFIRHGMEVACHILLHKKFLKEKHEHHSTLSLKKEVIVIIDKAKENGEEWYDIGWEFLKKKA